MDLFPLEGVPHDPSLPVVKLRVWVRWFGVGSEGVLCSAVLKEILVGLDILVPGVRDPTG